MRAKNLLPEFKEYLEKETNRLIKEYNGKNRSIAIISFAGESGGSNAYVNCIKKLATKFNITVNEKIIESARFRDAEGIIEEANKSGCNGIILVKPYSINRYYIEFLYNLIDGSKDIDGVGINSEYRTSTAAAVHDYLVDNIGVVGKNVAVLGRSRLVGMPIAQMLTMSDATVTLAHTKSNIRFVCHNADIIVSCTGSNSLIDRGLLNKDRPVTIIDVGYNVVNGVVCGDIDIDSISEMDNVSYLPAKGGIGNLTRLKLFENLL